MIRVLKGEGKEQILQTAKEKWFIPYKGTSIRVTPDFY
jgi:hypothetical protein